MFFNFIELFFPRVCITCDAHLLPEEKFLCVDCLYHLPQTNYHLTLENPVEKLFWGRVKINRAFSFLHYRKEGAVQKILHELKYSGNKELALFMGQYYGAKLKSSGLAVDYVMAVPLHKSKLLSRGYNQSEYFSQGLSETLGAEDISRLMTRTTATETQTRKNRFERFNNVKSAFILDKYIFLKNKRLLLVDDVITTGATIEALISSFNIDNHPIIYISSIASAS